MSIWQRLRYWWLHRTYDGTKLALREHLLFFGVDTSNLTDEELEAAVVEAGRMVAATGVTVAEANEALSSLGG